MILKSLQSLFILTWLVSITSILGFQPTSNSVTSRRSPFVSSPRFAKSVRLAAMWGASSNDENEEVEDEVEEPSTDDGAVSTSMESTGESSIDAKTPVSPEKSLLKLVNEIGNNFRTMAQKSTAKGYQSEDQYKRILHAAKACIYYSLFIVYRAYRGFFVLLPATFREVYIKMEAAMNAGNLSLEEIGFDESGEEVASSKSKWRTKVTVSILTTVITASYIVGGVVKMATRFVRTIAKTSDVPKSFGAAADEVINIEGRIGRVGKVNGQSAEDSAGLAP